MKNLYELSLFDITPGNLAQDKTVNNIIQAIDPDLKLITSDIQANLLLPRIDELDEKVLDLLAWQLHTDFYELAGTLKMKRDAVKNSILWHMKKGTVWAIHEALRQIGIKADYHNWYEYGGEPYTFKLDAIVTDDYYRRALDNKITENIRVAVEEAKSARSFLAELNTRIEFTDQKIIYAALVTHTTIRLELGVDLNTMHELLILFEKRIFERLENYERNLDLRIEEHNREINAKLDAIIELLKWREY